MPKTGYSCKQLRNYVRCGLFLACSMSPRLILLIWVASKTDDGKTAALNISGNVMYQRCDCIMLGCLCLEFRDLIVRCFWVSCIYAENVPSPVQGPGHTLLIFQVLRKTLLLRVDPPLPIYHLYNRRQLSHSGCSILHILATCTWLFFSAPLHIFHSYLVFCSLVSLVWRPGRVGSAQTKSIVGWMLHSEE